MNFLQYSWQCYLLVSKLSNFVDAYWQNFWFAVVSCMLLIKSRLYSFSKKTPYKKEHSYALLDLETVENEQSILTLPKRKLSNNNSIHDYSSKRKRRCGHFNWGFQFGRKRVDNEKIWWKPVEDERGDIWTRILKQKRSRYFRMKLEAYKTFMICR